MHRYLRVAARERESGALSVCGIRHPGCVRYAEQFDIGARTRIERSESVPPAAVRKDQKQRGGYE